MKKRADFNIILFLAIYLVLLQGFYVYVGLVTPGGRFSSPFLAQYFNIPWWLTLASVKPAKWLLLLCGYDVFQLNAANLGIGMSKSVTVAWGCIGIGAMGLWLGFIAAHRYMKIKARLIWIAAGIAFIYIINIARIIMIVLSNYYNWHYLHAFNAHTSFNILTYAAILVMMGVFVWGYGNTKKQKTRAENIAGLQPSQKTEEAV